MIMRLWILIVILAVAACEAEYTPPYLLYRADFDVAKVDEAEAVIKEIAEKWHLTLRAKDRKQMKFHTKGKDAFYTFLYYDDDVVLSLGNAGFGEVLSLMVVDYSKMPIQALERLTADVVVTLEDRLDLEFKRSDESIAPACAPYCFTEQQE